MGYSPLVSVVVPVYNTATYLARCLDSVLGQSYKNLQVILVDDGSTDESGYICDRYAEKDRRVCVIHSENGGPVRARKAGLMMAKGAFVGFVDSDDWIEDNMFESLVKILLQYNVDFVWSGMILEYGKRTIVTREFFAGFCNRPKEEFSVWSEIIEGQGALRGLVCKLFRRDFACEVFKAIPEDCVYGEDYIATVYSLLRCRNMYLIPDAFYHYDLSRPGSLTKEKSVELSLRMAKLYDVIYGILQQYPVDEKIKKIYQNAYVVNMLSSFNKWISGSSIQIYECSCIEKLYGKRLILYGAGNVGKDYYAQLSGISAVEIVGWVDEHPPVIGDYTGIVNSVEKIYELEYDLILIAVMDSCIAEEIKTELKNMDISVDRIIWSPVKRKKFVK